MTRHSADVYEFGPFRLEPSERRLLRGGQEVPLPPKAFDVLVALVSRAGRLVSKEDLLTEVWSGTFVEEASLSYTVSLLRKALQTDGSQTRYIDTVQKLGYRFAPDVRTLPADSFDSRPTEQAPGSPDGPQTDPTLGTVVSRSSSGPRRLWRWRGVVAMAALAAGGTWIALSRQTHDGEPARTRARFPVPVPEHIILGEADHPVISPDGKRIAFAGLSGGQRQLWIRPLDISEPIPLAGTEGATSPFWSPDSRSLAYFADRKLKKIDVDGGHPITLCDAAVPFDRASGGAWSSSGVILFANGALYRVGDKGGVPERVTTLEISRGERRHIVVGFLSDGRRFVFISDPPPGAYYVTSLDHPDQVRRLDIGPVATTRGLAISRGRFFYERDGIVFAHPFDERTLEPAGTPVTLEKTEPSPWPPRASVSRDGTVVFRSSWYTMRQLTWRRRSGEKTSVFETPGVITSVELSPNGTLAVVVRGGSGLQNRDLWLANFTSGVFSRMTKHPTLESSPAWAPDGRRIAYHSAQTGTIAPYIKDLETGKEERVFDPAESVVLDDWTPDGVLVLRTYGLAIFSLSLADRRLRQLADTPYTEDQLQVSPDNRWIAFNSDESDTSWEVYVARFPGFTEKRQLSVAGGVQPRWRRDGRELFYLAPDGTMMAVPFNPDGTVPTAATRALFKTSLNSPSFQHPEFDVSADGERFLILEPASTRPQVFTFLLNWMEGPTR